MLLAGYAAHRSPRSGRLHCDLPIVAIEPAYDGGAPGFPPGAPPHPQKDPPAMPPAPGQNSQPAIRVVLVPGAYSLRPTITVAMMCIGGMGWKRAEGPAATS